jgi:hypothetical protein
MPGSWHKRHGQPSRHAKYSGYNSTQLAPICPSQPVDSSPKIGKLRVSEATGEVLGQRKIARDQLIAKLLALGIFTSQIHIALVQPNQMRILTTLTLG